MGVQAMGPEYIVGSVMVIAFLAGGLVMSRRTRRGWSPRQQQRLHRGLLYYFVALGLMIGAAQLFSGNVRWEMMLWWCPFVLALLYSGWRKPSAKDHLKNYAQDSGHCGQCGYDLTGNVSGICPECGWSIPAAPVQAESLVWVQWWNGWEIAYLENWRRSLLSMIVLVAAFGGLAAWFLYGTPGPIMAILPILMAIHFALNIVRVIAYGRRQGAGEGQG